MKKSKVNPDTQQKESDLLREEKNPLSNTYNRKLREEAREKYLPIAKKIEADRIKSGHRYMTMGRTTKLVAPQNFEKNLAEGYKFLNKVSK